MNNLIELSVKFVKGAIDANTFADEYVDAYLSDTAGLRGGFPEAMLLTTVEHYNPSADRFEDEYGADELMNQIKQVLEGKHPLYADIDYPVIDLSAV